MLELDPSLFWDTLEKVTNSSPTKLRRLLTGKTVIPMSVWKRRDRGQLVAEVMKEWLDGELDLPGDLEIDWDFR